MARKIAFYLCLVLFIAIIAIISTYLINPILSNFFNTISFLDIISLVLICFDLYLLTLLLSVKGITNRKPYAIILLILFSLVFSWHTGSKIINNFYTFDFINYFYIIIVGFIIISINSEWIKNKIKKIRNYSPRISSSETSDISDVSSKSYKWLYYAGLLLILVLNLFLYATILMINDYSLIDEYNHIISGVEFFDETPIEDIFNGDFYRRGFLMTFLVGLSLMINKSLLLAKIVPVVLGLINLVLFWIITKKILSRFYIIFALLFYSIYPWVIFNHIYIRHYVIIELFLFILIIVLFKIFKLIKNKQYNFDLILYFLLLSLLNVIYYFTQADITKYVIPGFTILFFTIYLICKKYYRYLYVIIPFIIYLFLLIYSYFNIIDFKFLSSSTGNSHIAKSDLFIVFFYYLFFLSMPFILYSTLLSKRRATFRDIFYLTTLGFFLAITFILTSSQTIRGTSFLIPLIILFSVAFISRFSVLKKGRLMSLILLSLILLSILAQYPKGFISHPYIPHEINYIDYNKSHEFIYNIPRDDILIISILPAGISSFHNIEPDYILRDNEASFNNPPLKYQYKMKKSSFYSVFSGDYTDIDYITNTDDFINIIDKNRDKTIYIISLDFVFLRWLSEDAQYIIDKVFRKEAASEIFEGITIYSLHKNGTD